MSGNDWWNLETHKYKKVKGDSVPKTRLWWLEKKYLKKAYGIPFHIQYGFLKFSQAVQLAEH